MKNLDFLKLRATR